MVDLNFFKREGPFTLSELADRTGAFVHDESCKDFVIEDVAPLDCANDKQISFLDNVKYKQDFAETKAGACIISADMLPFAPKECRILLSNYPYKTYALVAQAFYPEEYPVSEIHDSAIIHETAVIEKGCVIGAGVVIGPHVKIGQGSWVEANAVIDTHVQIGEKCRIGLNASVSHAVLGDSVRLYPGVRVGQDGFGFAMDPSGHVKVPQLGRVIIEDHVEVGANTTIDRGSGPDTVIGQGTWIDNLVQIGHNVKVGRGCVIIAQAGIAGSTVLGDYVVIAAQVGVAGHLFVGSGARVGAQSGVMRDIEGGAEYLGTPAVPAKQFMRQVAYLGKLVKENKGAKQDG